MFECQSNALAVTICSQEMDLWKDENIYFEGIFLNHKSGGSERKGLVCNLWDPFSSFSALLFSPSSSHYIGVRNVSTHRVSESRKWMKLSKLLLLLLLSLLFPYFRQLFNQILAAISFSISIISSPSFTQSISFSHSSSTKGTFHENLL